MESSEIWKLREERSKLRQRLEDRRRTLHPGNVVSVESSTLSRTQPAILDQEPRKKPARTADLRINSGSSLTKNFDDDESSAKTRNGEYSSSSSLRRLVAACLLEENTNLPMDSTALTRKIEKAKGKAALSSEFSIPASSTFLVEQTLKSMAGAKYAALEIDNFVVNGKRHMMVLGFDRKKLEKELPPQPTGPRSFQETPLRPPNPSFPPHVDSGFPVLGLEGSPDGRRMFPPHSTFPDGPHPVPPGRPNTGRKPRREDEFADIEQLLSKKSYREAEKSRSGEELLQLIQKPTVKQTAVVEKFKSKGGSAVREFCPSLTREDCMAQGPAAAAMACGKMHFRRIIAPHTDTSLGDCSFLDTCRHMKTCKYVHYELDADYGHLGGVTPAPLADKQAGGGVSGAGEGSWKLLPRSVLRSPPEALSCQWVNCDIRSFRMDVLGQFGVIMADPPWDIHMELPYGTMADDEMRGLNIQALQSDGLIFLWVTGRAMELGRECLELWGYKRVEELIWVKTNQLQRIIRTGRTGHWLNHSKEHCLIGIKGKPRINANVDTDVLVAEVRETSRKPDEMYSLLERISPNTRKLEIFARMHNKQPGWVSMGNQLDGVRIVDPAMRNRFRTVYPDIEIQPSDAELQA